MKRVYKTCEQIQQTYDNVVALMNSSEQYSLSAACVKLGTRWQYLFNYISEEQKIALKNTEHCYNTAKKIFMRDFNDYEKDTIFIIRNQYREENQKLEDLKLQIQLIENEIKTKSEILQQQNAKLTVLEKNIYLKNNHLIKAKESLRRTKVLEKIVPKNINILDKNVHVKETAIEKRNKEYRTRENLKLAYSQGFKKCYSTYRHTELGFVELRNTVVKERDNWIDDIEL